MFAPATPAATATATVAVAGARVLTAGRLALHTLAHPSPCSASLRLAAVCAHLTSSSASGLPAGAPAAPRRQLHAQATARNNGKEDNFAPPTRLADTTHVKGHDEYLKLYRDSLDNNDAFWSRMAKEHISWSAPFQQTKQQGPGGTADTHWFVGGQLNACYNAVDRHVPEHGDKVAIIWESDDGKSERKITYAQLHAEVQRAANALKALGVGKGDVVVLYMPMTPEAMISMLACARIGAVHNCVFAGFSDAALRERIQVSSAKLVITADEMMRGGKHIPLKATVDQALNDKCDTVKHTLVLKRTGGAIEWKDGRDRWWHDEVHKAAPHCPAVPMDSDDPLFVLFTSGSTGKPKGLVHAVGGYMTYAATTTKYAFDLNRGDVYFCGADIGWITGHTYITYGPLTLGATVLLYEGHPTYPHEGRYWEVIEKHAVKVFYTSPTAVRSLMSLGEAPLAKFNRGSLRVLGSVGEPINEAAWRWLHKEVGGSGSPIIDTYWQTETGGIVLCPLPGATTLKPGSASFPFFGIDPALYDEQGNEVVYKPGEPAVGVLGIKRAWPGLARTILNNHERYLAAYFPNDKHPTVYMTGDQARRDADSYYWITGRVDDVVNVSGHRISSAEVEGAIAHHPRTAEAAVVAMPHDIKGECLVAFVCIKEGAAAQSNEEFVKQVRSMVAKDIGKLAVPDVVLVVRGLPKTRSGKIMRRLLRNIVLGKTEAKDLGDTSTLADPAVVEQLIQLVQAHFKAKKTAKA